ncbi:hypothetical protein DUNSADRAFT_3755 [Dunaliella salina]|uniref:Encoded protein n=1 Tax=Dunaliella salina TaxID=3046 RepID=A0ABQ7GTG1_DUNSA|nr:hypothetical protein DUNSADRAFT_3755 [Dunaliella salina]|eukprot:KAF5837862.1 hypothetical protein DUNSADRAFT_3755 [Dunaliella salina]
MELVPMHQSCPIGLRLKHSSRRTMSWRSLRPWSSRLKRMCVAALSLPSWSRLPTLGQYKHHKSSSSGSSSSLSHLVQPHTHPHNGGMRMQSKKRKRQISAWRRVCST